MIVDLTAFYEHVPAFLLVLGRMAGLFMLAPVFSSTAVFRQVKIGLAVVLAFAVYPALLAGNSSGPMIQPFIGSEISIWTLVMLVGWETLLGYVMGWVITIPLTAIQFGGFIIDYKVGLGFAQTINPELGESAAPVSQVLYMLGLALFVIHDGHLVFLGVMLDTFAWIPLGGLTDFGYILDLALGMMALLMDFSLKIAAPILCLIFLETVAMGFLAKTVPQLNILTVGLPLRILVAGTVLFSIVPLFAELYGQVLDEVLAELVAWLTGM